jgi:hypothetical protein
MDIKISDFFEPIELIEPAKLGKELTMAAGAGVIKCDKGYVCGIGEVEVN